MSHAVECPICMDPIETSINCVTTECGHMFHCKCLMQNSVHNGFNCPYCRNPLAEKPTHEHDDDCSYISDFTETIFDDDALTSFRMFHQRINEEEIEDEPEPDDNLEVFTNHDSESEYPTAEYVASKLLERGITMTDLVKSLLIGDHPEIVSDSNEGEYNLKGGIIFGQINAISQLFRRQNLINV